MNKIKKIFKRERKFDERQLILEGKVGTHAFFIVMILLTIDMLLTRRGITWTSNSSMIIAAITIAVAGVEAVFKEVFFEYKRDKWIIIFCCFIVILVLVYVFFMYSCPVCALDCETCDYGAWIKDGALTDRGNVLIFGVFYSVIPIAFIIKIIRDKLKKQTEEAADL